EVEYGPREAVADPLAEGLGGHRAGDPSGAVPRSIGAGPGGPETKNQVRHGAFSGGHKWQLRRGGNRTSEDHLAGAGRGDGRGGERTSAEYRVRLLCDPAPKRPIRVSLVSV